MLMLLIIIAYKRVFLEIHYIDPVVLSARFLPKRSLRVGRIGLSALFIFIVSHKDEYHKEVYK